MNDTISPIFGHEKNRRNKGKCELRGGDVIIDRDIAFIGHSRRSNKGGVEQLKSILESIGYRMVCRLF